MKDWKAIAEKQAELIEHYQCKGNWNYANPDWDRWNDKLSKLHKDLFALESQEVEGVQPKIIEAYFNEKDKRIIDDMGWTGEYHLSAKDIIDFIIDNHAQSSKVSDTDIEIFADEQMLIGSYGCREDKIYQEGVELGAKAMRDNLIK